MWRGGWATPSSTSEDQHTSYIHTHTCMHILAFMHVFLYDCSVQWAPLWHSITAQWHGTGLIFTYASGAAALSMPTIDASGFLQSHQRCQRGAGRMAMVVEQLVVAH